MTDVPAGSVNSDRADFWLSDVWGFALVFLIVSATALGATALEYVAFVVVVPVAIQILQTRSVPKPKFSKSDFVFIALAFQYPVWHFLIASVRPGVARPSDIILVEEPVAWLALLGILAVMTWRMADIRDLAKIWRYTAPAGLALAFLFLTVDFFTDFQGNNCRVSGLVFNPNIPPVFFTIFTIASFLGWAGLSRNEHLVRYALVAAAVIVVTAYSGSRMILLVQVLTFGLLSFIVPVAGTKRRLQTVASLGAAGIVGILIGFSIDALSGCGFLGKLGILANAVGSMNPEVGESIAIRANLYDRALYVVAANPWVGVGIPMEKILAGRNYHVHNQYLSWMIWGGVFSLISGLAYLVSASIMPVLRGRREGLILALAATGVLAANFFTDTLLHHPFVYIQHAMALALFFGLGRSILAAVDAPHDQDPDKNGDAK